MSENTQQKYDWSQIFTSMLWAPGSLESVLPENFHKAFFNDKQGKWNLIKVLGSVYCDIKGWEGRTQSMEQAFNPGIILIQGAKGAIGQKLSVNRQVFLVVNSTLW